MKLNEKTGLYENYGVWHTPFWQTKEFKFAAQICLFLAGVLVLALVVKLYLAYRKQKKLSPWEQALQVLSDLKKRDIISIVHGKEFYLSVSSLLKTYFHDRFGYDVLGKTDGEFVEYLSKYHKDELILEEIRLLLDGASIIKFANAQAAQEQLEHDYIRAVSIIQRTMPEGQ